jgi:hypothetical protein
VNAELLVEQRLEFADDAFAELRIWRVPAPVRASGHDYKYRLAYVERGTCVLRYDNEAGKGDHRHLGEEEESYSFTSIEQLVADFRREVERWRLQ